MSTRILLVEDNVELARTIMQFMALEAIEVDYVGNGNAGYNLAKSNCYDVLVLDINLPGISGLTLCEKLRKDAIDLPILMLTACDTLTDKLAGFEAGTDDYLVKPFSLEELLARVKVLDKRRSGQTTKLQVADLIMDLDAKLVMRGQHQLILSPICWRLLEVLMRCSPNVVSRENLLQTLWGDEPPDSNNLKVHMHKLRKTIDSDGVQSLITTVRGHGFMLKVGDENAKEYS